MQLQLVLPEGTSKEGIIHFKNFLKKEAIDGVEDVEVERTEHGDGQMGAGDILNSVKTLIEAATKPLTELVIALQKYVENYRTVITIATPNGNIEISHGRSMKPNELKDLVTAIQEKTL